MNAMRNEVKAKIWLVDDETDLLRSYAEYLGPRYQTQVFSSADAALEAFDREKISADLVISDVKMVGLDGLQLIERLKSRKMNAPVLLISGYAERKHLAQAVALGVAGFLEKPCTTQDLENRVGEILARERRRQIDFTVARARDLEAELSDTLIAHYIDRYSFAENRLHDEGITLHKSPEAAHRFLNNLTEENRLARDRERLRQDIARLQQERSTLL